MIQIKKLIDITTSLMRECKLESLENIKLSPFSIKIKTRKLTKLTKSLEPISYREKIEKKNKNSYLILNSKHYL